jgi:hypothetical protein
MTAIGDTQHHAICCELISDVVQGSGEVRLKLTGTSMMTSMWPGDVVSVSKVEDSELNVGQIVLYRDAGRLIAHRIVRMSDDWLITRGDSMSQCDCPVHRSDVICHVTKISRNGIAFSPAQSPGQRLLSSFLRRSSRLTRAALRIGNRRGWPVTHAN